MHDLDSPLLDLKNVRCFVAAAEHGSLSGAASSLGMAQSALSRQVSQLESLLDCRLFHRTGRGVSLTEIGHAILPRAQLMLQTASQLVDDVSAQRSRPAGNVTIGVLPGLSRPLIGRVLRRMLVTYPDIRLKAVEAYSGEVENMLAEGRADIGIFNRYRPTQRDVHDAILHAPIYLVGRSGRFDSDRKSLKLAAIARLPLVLPARPNGMRSYLDEACNRRGLRLNVVLEATSGTLIREAIVNCDAYSLLPYHAVAEEIRSGILAMTPITNPVIQQTAFVDTTRKHPLSNASKAVFKIVIEEMRALDALVRQAVD
ncbi:LysR family transcriptional regulator [Allopusillimonas soli]|uniref:LysR family transcriptional regulator n=1 Tax=Allopusillimonas soli TaxID=659016 RepID=A0A853F8E0_9BURK|nr:LysR family transcriptional regulator [Allopusillimonas soli]NYT36078.1 LysR family transcriptional regulator [Allopusillimonas soli]TEA76415.1 LysR family transcriptional regulator [Allopusillimonas soli]